MGGSSSKVLMSINAKSKICFTSIIYLLFPPQIKVGEFMRIHMYTLREPGVSIACRI